MTSTATIIVVVMVMMTAVVILVSMRAACAGAAAINCRHCIDIVVCAATAAVFFLGWEKFTYREFKRFKQFAGILTFAADSAVAGTILFRHAEFVCWEPQLNIAFQFNDRELTEGYDKNVRVGV